MSTNNKKVIILNFQKESDQSASLRGLEKMYEKHANVDVLVVANGTEAAQLAKMYQGGLFLFSVFDKRDVAQVLTFIAGATTEIQDGTIKLAGYNNLNNKKLEKYLSQNGCAEEFYGRLTAKTLGYKITLWFKAIEFAASKAEERRRREEEAKASEIRFINSMKLASDCWILNNKEDVHNTLRQWFLEVIGPSPCAGRWVEIENKKDHYDKYWEWKPKMEQEFPFITDLGSWIFKGVEPKFSWKSSSWQFTGKDIYLGFYHQDSEQIDYRFVANDKGAEIAENSSNALSKREMIFESCDPKYHVENEDFYQKKDAHFDKEAVVKNLEGDVSNEGDKIDGLMRGNLKQGANNQGHYQGELDQERDCNSSQAKERAASLDLELEGHLDQLKKEANEANLNHIDNLLKGKATSSLDLGLEKAAAEKESQSYQDEQSEKKHKNASLGLELDKGAKESSDQSLEDEIKKQKSLLSSALQLDLDEISKKQEKEEQERKKREAAQKNTKLDLEAEEEQRERLLEEEKKKIRKSSALDLGLPKVSDDDPHQAQVDHLQKYYGFVHEMGLNPELTSDDTNGQAIDEEGKNNRANKQAVDQNKASSLPLDAQTERALATGKNGLPHLNSNKSGERAAENDNPKDSSKAAAGQIPQGDQSKYGQGSTDKLGGDDLDGEGNRAEYIEKYYGTKKRELADDDPNKRQARERETKSTSPRQVAEQQKSKPLQAAKEVDLFGGDKANLQDIKLLVQIIRKSKSTGIFDDSKAVELSDLFDNFMVVTDSDKASIEEGERVLIKVDCSYLGRNNFYDFFGTIAEVEQEESDEDASRNHLRVELTKFEKKHLEEISRVFLERQANILKFFKAAKGLE